MLFCSWLLSLNITSVRFTHVAVCGCSLSFLTVCIAFCQWVNTAPLVYATADGHLDSFQFGSITDGLIGEHVYVCWFDMYLGVKL